MSDQHPQAAAVRRFWATTEARDWAGLADLLSPDLVYEMEQTRERVRGRDGFLRFFDQYPGDWHLTVRRIIADDGGAVSVVDFTVGAEKMTGVSFFEFDDGLITKVEDLWPEPYDPPAHRAGLTERF